MIYSLYEIDAHCKKAARGVGFEWGYAEEVGKIARWLAAYGLPGTSVLAAYLTQRDSTLGKFSGPITDDVNDLVTTKNAQLCPVLTGAYLCDRVQPNFGTKLKFENIAYPILLLPCLAQLANASNQTVIYQYDQNQFRFTDGKLECVMDASLNCSQTSDASCLFNSDSINGKPTGVKGQQISDLDWQRLNEFALKTYVPASEASRQGAGPTD